ncbi:MAG: single-stranded-DNA-specific exonuclease RecJ [Deltaproteobacteria bacterium]|jgi:single-stranded-DNA-specific exonuclease|nr:single-stranded-DNA-specific exonuclease RecJ [Deltaproteobacteria bacterium]
MIWNYRQPVDLEEARKFALILEKPMKYIQFLQGRGYQSLQDIKDFREADLKSLPAPESLPGMQEAVSYFLQAYSRHDTIAIFGDYDADGLTSTALLTITLESLGFKVISQIPNRLSDGYGLNSAAVRNLHSKGAGLLVTVDCGVSDWEAVTTANELKFPVIITDHHQIPPILPPAQAIINPHLGGGWETHPLAGVGVAFMLAWAIVRAFKYHNLCQKLEPPLVETLALVALGTIADLAPLTGTNRILVRQGLRFLEGTSWPSLKALKSSANLEKDQKISTWDVGFRLAPKLNAAGRMGNANPALELLITKDLARAQKLADVLTTINQNRYDSQVRLLEDALKLLKSQAESPDSRTVVLAKEKWPRGLLGLVASRIAEIFRKPTILLCLENEFAYGSGRSIPGFDLFSALGATRHICISVGGHAEAAGLKLRAADISAFKEAFEESAKLQPIPPQEAEILIDLEVDYDDLEVLYNAFQDLEPFGQGHPAPLVALRDIEVIDAVPTRTKGDKHIMLRLSKGPNSFSFVGFNMAQKLYNLEKKIDLVLSLDNSRFNQKITGWRLVDFKKAGESLPPYRSL